MGRKPCRHSINSHIQAAMKLNLSTLAFGSIIEKGGGTPSWGTELGQSKPDYKFTVDGCEEILVGMLYNSVNLHNVSLTLGKCGHLDIASNFDELHFKAVIVNKEYSESYHDYAERNEHWLSLID